MEETILIVDDEVSNIHTISEYLEQSKKGYKITRATHGKMALKVIEKYPPDLIITDWEMPKMNGLELIKALKANAEMQKIPCIMVTGIRVSDENLKQAMDAGAADFLRKPINRIELWARVNATLRLYQANKELEVAYEREKKLMEQALQHKDQELAKTSMASFEKNELLKQIEQKLSKLESEVSKKNWIKLKEIKKVVSANKHLDNDWNSFVHQFENVHPDFFDKLKKAFPELSINDLKICAYLKIGMQIKEVATITNVSPAASYKQIYRLKKKLNLPEEMTVRDWVLLL